jgi:hypothetical protein
MAILTHRPNTTCAHDILFQVARKRILQTDHLSVVKSTMLV